MLRHPATIRERCTNILRAAEQGQSAHFKLSRSKLDAVAQRIATLTTQRFPDLKIPYHSRWRHFEAGGVDRKSELDAKLAGRSAAAVARARIDLTLISVLLDAGAGPRWRYVEPKAPAWAPSPAHNRPLTPALSRMAGEGAAAASECGYSRSEGLAVASFRAFVDGRFSSDPGDPCRVDAAALLRIDAAALTDIFQVTPENPLVGLDGRAALLRRLGQALREQPATFTAEGQPGHLFDALTHHRHAPAITHHHPQTIAPATHHLSAARILQALLDAFSPIWPSGQHVGGLPVGDAWPHPHAGGDGPGAGWVPFHKLSQWLTYSLLEPFEWAGVHVNNLDQLTGLPEYRNGGLLIDAGVIVPRDERFAHTPRAPGDEWVIEWRALTVALLDELAPLVRARLNVTAGQLPLARMLEGGSWAAGRQIAAERRPGGAPPVIIVSDGTVF